VRTRIAGLLAVLFLLAGISSAAAAGPSTPAAACDPVLYLCV
jgi:hypothetical protein